MVTFWAVRALTALAALSTVRAVCDDLENYLSVPSPMTGDITITLDADTIECPALDADLNDMEVEEIIVEGGTLTIASDNNVQFINVAFTVLSGGALVFDMPQTAMGPNDGSTEDFPSGELLDVRSGASVTFNGDMVAQEIDNVNILIKNAGSMEFKKTAYFENNINGIPVNTGTIKFRGATTFKGHDGIAIENSEGGFVRFSETADFEHDGNDLDGFAGCDIINSGLTSKFTFRGDTTFSNTNCRSTEGVSLYNNGIMNFYGKAYFSNNVSWGNGGAVLNVLGSMRFRGAVQFNDNEAGRDGGGIAVEGGDVTFKKAVKFKGNSADSGGAFALIYRETTSTDGTTSSGSITFEKPSVVSFVDNTVDAGDDNCTVGEVEDGTILIGFPGDDVCVAASS